MAKINTNPEVRFAGFEQDWEERELSKILKERKVMQKITEDAPILAFAAGQGVIDRSERKSNNRDHLTHDQENKIYKLTELNDIVYNPSNLKYGAIDRNKHGRGVISPIYVTFTTEEEPSFVELIVKSEKFKLRALQYEEGTVVKRQSVKPENLLSLKVNISSSKDEQKKIGELFDSLETLIKLHQVKRNKLLNVRRSIIQKLFPKLGSNLPAVRFNNFSDSWKELEIGLLADRHDNLRVPVKADKRVAGQTPYYGANGIQGYVKGHTHEGEFILVAEDGANNLKNYPVQYVNGKIWVNNHAHVLQAKKGIANNIYLKYAISSTNIEPFLVGGGRAKLNSEPMMKIKVWIPEDIKEQEKIGTYLYSIDQLLSLHVEGLEKIINIKKACFEKLTSATSKHFAQIK
ncbi:MAG TPA: restriction endonuclease subunit S [Bacteroidales bacterium]|nr:restriction endonuclease subunit S [Bacteroidales bacterium]